MVLKSEGAAIKYVNHPAKDRKYCLVAYSKLLVEYGKDMSPEVVTELVSALIESANPAGKNTQFQIASSIRQGTDEMLMDGAID